ncbi:MAG TPA: efflux RND transporter permease subunit [Gemmatimonadales bacterium]|nr:efflux RND transporter permease subunit [Gemmatimonadales bacterium]
MFLSDTSVKRPVLATMMSLAIVLFGAIGYTRLSVREYPDIDPPIISVSTFLPGANPRVMESAVTDILEEELSTVEGLRTLTSTSGEQSSNITLEFNLGRSVESAAQDVRDKVSRVRGRLPREVLEPVIAKQDADAQPFYWLALSGANYTLLDLSDIGDRIVKQRLQTIPGVGNSFIAGERRISMRIWVSAKELAARGLTVQDVESAVRSRNVEIPAGRIESDNREFTVRSLGELKTPQEFGDLVVANQGGQLVRLRDLARVELGPRDERSVLRFNGTSAVAVGIVRQSKANMVDVADSIRAALPKIEEALPPGVQLRTAFDQSVYVKRSISETIDTLFLAFGLVVIIIFLFLRNLRATIIPGLAIPVSIIGAFGVMYFLGFSINTFTLLALILAIGLVVDDAIIVLENAYRHQEELGETPENAAMRGTSEIGFAVIATTVSLVAVFAPLAFLQGTTGRLFNEFGVALAGSVVISGFVALTLTPMLCARILRVPKSHGAVYQSLERGLNWLAVTYAATLAWAIRHRAVIIGGAGVSLLVAYVTFHALKREFIPAEDRGFFMASVTAPQGSTVEYTDGYQRQVEAVMAGVPDIRSYFSVVGFGGDVSGGFLFVNMKDWRDRVRSTQEVIGGIMPQLFGIPGVQAFAFAPSPIGGFGSPVQFVVQHPDFDSLTAVMPAFLERARQIKGLVNVQSNLKVNKPELTVRYDRDRAEDLGVSVSDVGSTLETMLGGRRVSTFTRDNKLYDVMVQMSPEDRATPSDMTALYVRGRQGQLINMAAVTTVDEGVGPQRLFHYNRVPSFTISANPLPGFTLGEALDSLNAAAAELLPRGSSTALSGELREFAESGTALYFAFLLALLVVYMVLAAQFESLVHPFTVLLAVPLAVTGALVTLFFTGATLNLYSQIGMILLIGLASKNSILLVEYANQLREQGKGLLEATLEAGRVRLRPILMTAFATIFGALPIALGLSAGSESRQPLGYVIVGGMFVSTFLTLYLVPVVYVLLETVREKMGARRHAVTESSAGIA